MKCNKCSSEWKTDPIRSASIKICPFCQEPIASEKKAPQSFDNVADTFAYIKEEESLGIDALLGEKVYTYFADLTRNQLRDEKDLIKQICEKGALKCLKEAIGKPNEYENAIKRALSKLPKYLQSSPEVADMLNNFAAALGWKIEPKQNSANLQNGISNNLKIIVTPPIGSIYKFADIDWRVLAVENNKALLISENILEKRPYNVEYVDTTWEACTLRKYLNGEFYNSFGSAKSAIADTPNKNLPNQWYGTSGGNATTDKVFLLSLDEVCRYFGDSTANLSKKGSTGSDYYIDDKNNAARVANYGKDGASWWWLRSPGNRSRSAARVYDGGRVDVLGNIVNFASGGVRPALLLNL